MVDEDLRLWTIKARSLAWNGYMRLRDGIPRLQKVVEDLKDIPGDIVELGTYKGATAIAMAAMSAQVSPEKRVYAFDTFSGMPEPEDVDEHEAGEFLVSFEKVRIDTLGLPNLELVQGDIVETVPDFRIEQVSLLFLDCDLYRPHIVGLEKFVPLIADGGVVIFEDYFTNDCPGATLAYLEYFGGWTAVEQKHGFCSMTINGENRNKVTHAASQERDHRHYESRPQ